MILVVSHEGDEHAANVLKVLRDREHPAVLMDTAQYPRNATISQRFENDAAPSSELMINETLLDLGTCRTGWWRRPQPFTLDSNLDPNVAGFSYTECHEAVAGLWASLNLNWVNQPQRDEVAHHKPYQLQVATEIGLAIPRTLITNDPVAARKFAAEIGNERTIYKTFMATEQHWRETRLLRKEELLMLDRVSLAPLIFQEFVPAVADLRVTIVGRKIFAAEITQGAGAYTVDYRMDMPGANFRPTKLPLQFEKKLLLLMRRLGLLYGAIDLRRKKDGQHVFLEVNPAGEWLFVEERTGQRITEGMADLLIELDK